MKRRECSGEARRVKLKGLSCSFAPNSLIAPSHTGLLRHGAVYMTSVSGRRQNRHGTHYAKSPCLPALIPPRQRSPRGLAAAWQCDAGGLSLTERETKNAKRRKSFQTQRKTQAFAQSQVPSKGRKSESESKSGGGTHGQARLPDPWFTFWCCALPLGAVTTGFVQQDVDS